MAKSVGMREFKNRFNEIVREMEGTCEEVVVTRRGREVFRAVPIRRGMTPEEVDKWLAESEEFAQRVAKVWPEGLSAAEAIRRDRDRL
ncbi:MAG TPA: type II toxin-antitoxin system Phd/YefM family antitoxin [Dehalococcoidia bacterium]|jgi:prevent-host-death family protein